MNTFLLVLLCIFEAAFAITAISRKTDKKGWQTGRLICNAGQLGLFLVMLIAPGIDMSFRFMGLFVLLIIRIIIAFIGYLIVKKKRVCEQAYRKDHNQCSAFGHSYFGQPDTLVYYFRL